MGVLGDGVDGVSCGCFLDGCCEESFDFGDGCGGFRAMPVVIIFLWNLAWRKRGLECGYTCSVLTALRCTCKKKKKTYND